MFRTAMNGDEEQARRWCDRMSAIADGHRPDDRPKVLITSQAEMAAFFAQR